MVLCIIGALFAVVLFGFGVVFVLFPYSVRNKNIIIVSKTFNKYPEKPTKQVTCRAQENWSPSPKPVKSDQHC